MDTFIPNKASLKIGGLMDERDHIGFQFEKVGGNKASHSRTEISKEHEKH